MPSERAWLEPLGYFDFGLASTLPTSSAAGQNGLLVRSPLHIDVNLASSVALTGPLQFYLRLQLHSRHASHC